MFGRLLIYLGTLWIEQQPGSDPGDRYQLAAAVVNLTGTTKSLPASVRQVWPGRDGMECVLTVRERWLAMESAEEALDRIASGRYDRPLLPWIPLMKGGGEAAVIARAVELAAAETDERKRGDLGYDLLVFAEKSADPGAWHKALEGWGMIKSQVMEKTRREERAESLLEWLASRTNQAVPEELAGKIRASVEMAQLRAWQAIAARIDTLEQFRTEAGL